MPDKTETSSQQGWECGQAVLLPASQHHPLPVQHPQTGSQHTGFLGELPRGNREVWGHRNTCRARTPRWVMHSRQPKLPHTASDTGTPCSLQTRLVDGSTWRRRNSKGSNTSLGSGQPVHTARARPGSAALVGAENPEGWSAKAMGNKDTSQTPGERGNAWRVPHCPIFYQVLLATGQQTYMK